MTRPRRIILAVLLWMGAIAAAAMLDGAVARYMRDSGAAHFMRSHPLVAGLLKAPGEYYVTAAVAVAVVWAHALGWRAGGFVLLATAVSGANGLIKWIAGRTRPFKLTPEDVAAPFALSPFRGGWAGLFESRNLCFPSGHAALAFATATAVAMLWPTARWRWVGYAIAAVVAVQRVAENAHWLSDCVAAAALGVGGVYLIRWVVTRGLGVEPEGDERSVRPRLTA